MFTPVPQDDLGKRQMLWEKGRSFRKRLQDDKFRQQPLLWNVFPTSVPPLRSVDALFRDAKAEDLLLAMALQI